jgi:predicted dithiol-disulfide oxidoreductase (DUF899 family)
MTGTDVGTYTREREGMSAFVLEGGVVYHTYSTYARGVDAIWGMYLHGSYHRGTARAGKRARRASHRSRCNRGRVVADHARDPALLTHP